MAGHRGVQLAAHTAARATIQTAVVLATALGSSKKKNAPGIRKIAYDLLCGELEDSPLDIDVVDLALDEEFRKVEAKLDAKLIAESEGRRVDPDEAHPIRKLGSRGGDQIDMVLTPLDGAESLRDGSSGSVTAVAAGPHGAFHRPVENAPSYFIIAVGKERVDRQMDDILKRHSGSITEVGRKLQDVFGSDDKGDATCSLVNDIVGKRNQGENPNVQPVVAVMTEEHTGNWRPSITHWHRRRRLEGSAVAAALAAFTGKVPYSIFVSRRPQVIQAAIAARALGGRLLALPIRIKRPDKEKVQKRDRNQQEATVPAISAGNETAGKRPKVPKEVIVTAMSDRFFRETDFVDADNAILCCTSISEVCVMERVRFGFDYTATADTMFASLATGKVTRQKDILQLDRANFCDPDGNEIPAGDLMHAFKLVLTSNDDLTLAVAVNRQREISKKKKADAVPQDVSAPGDAQPESSNATSNDARGPTRPVDDNGGTKRSSGRRPTQKAVARVKARRDKTKRNASDARKKKRKKKR